MLTSSGWRCWALEPGHGWKQLQNASPISLLDLSSVSNSCILNANSKCKANVHKLTLHKRSIASGSFSNMPAHQFSSLILFRDKSAFTGGSTTNLHLWADVVTTNTFKNIRFGLIRDMLMDHHVFCHRFTRQFIKNIHTSPFKIYLKVPTPEKSVSIVHTQCCSTSFSNLFFNILDWKICGMIGRPRRNNGMAPNSTCTVIPRLTSYPTNEFFG